MLKEIQDTVGVQRGNLIQGSRENRLLSLRYQIKVLTKL